MASRRMEGGHCDPEWCPIEVSIEVIGGTWKVIIVRELLGGTKRYSQLHRALKRVTHKMLAQQLRELERDGVITRKVYPQVPPKVEYSLTALGDALGPVLDSMHSWGARVIARRAVPSSASVAASPSPGSSASSRSSASKLSAASTLSTSRAPSATTTSITSHPASAPSATGRRSVRRSTVT